MENIPDELLLLIFSKLSFTDLLTGVRTTCWRWYHLSRDNTLWTNIDLSLIKCYKDTKNIHSGIKNMLREVHDSLERLSFSNLPVDGGIYELFGSSRKKKNKVKFEKLKALDYSYSDASFRNLRVALTNHPDIEELILVHTKILFAQALEEAIHLPNLKRLIYHDSTSRDIVSDRLINKLNVLKVPRHCQRLEVVELHTISVDLDYGVISQFLKYCTNLKKLSLTWSTNLTSDSFLGTEPLVHHITHLGLHDRQETGPYLDFVLPHFPNLVHLTAGGKNIHLDDSKAISEFCPKLKELVLEIHCGDVPCTSCFFHSLCGLQLQIIAEKCTQLTKVHVPYSNIDDDSVIFLAEHCLFLEDLDFSQCHRLTKNALFALSKHCLRLKKVNLLDTFIDHRYLIGLVTKCSKLEEVLFDHKYKVPSSLSNTTSMLSTCLMSDLNESSDDVHSNDDIPFIDLTESADEYEMHQTLLNILSRADTSTQSTSDDTSFIYPETLPYTPVKINHCHLKKLSMKYSLAKDRYLQEIIFECPDLTYVSLDGSKHLTDNLIITLAKSCPNLRHLGISSNPSKSSQAEDTFGDPALLALVQYCHNLEALQCLYNSHMTITGLAALFQSLGTSLRSLCSLSLCVDSSFDCGYGCNVSSVALHGLKYLTEHSKQQLKDAAATSRGSYIVLHLDFVKRR